MVARKTYFKTFETYLVKDSVLDFLVCLDICSLLFSVLSDCIEAVRMGGLKVIGAGFGRTGAFSLKMALDRLGLHCYHTFELLNKPLDAPLWLRTIDDEENRRRLFEQIFSGYEATVDFPSVYFYRELLEYYPDAKVILTLRDSNSWYESFSDTVMEANKSLRYKIARLVHGHAIYQLMKKTFVGMLGTNLSDRQHIIKVFEHHNADVLKHVPAERLLIYHVEQGWKPLCDFLNIPMPEDLPFPHFNEREKMLERINKMKILGGMYIVVYVAIISVAVGLFFQYW